MMIDPNLLLKKPYRVRCVSCDEIGYVGRSRCTCGASIEDQVEREFHHWCKAETLRLQSRATAFNVLSIVLMVFGFMSFTILLVLEILMDVQDALFEKFGPHGHLIVLSTFGIFCIGLALGRKKKRLDQRSVSLTLEDFLEDVSESDGR